MIGEDEVIFDTYKQVKKLMAAGVPEPQAEAQVEIFIQFIDGNLATKVSLAQVAADLKRDMKELEAGLKRDMKELEAGLKRDIKELETNLKHDIKDLDLKIESLRINLSKEITIKMGVMAAITISVLATLIKLG